MVRPTQSKPLVLSLDRTQADGGFVGDKSKKNDPQFFVDGLLDQIKKELQTRSPMMVGFLNPPAAIEDIEAFESRFGITLPADYRAFLLRHNGTNEAFGKFDIYSLDRLTKRHLAGGKEYVNGEFFPHFRFWSPNAIMFCKCLGSRNMNLDLQNGAINTGTKSESFFDFLTNIHHDLVNDMYRRQDGRIWFNRSGHTDY